MTSTKQKPSGTGFLDSLRNSPATDRLKEQARGFASAGADKVGDRLGGTLGSVTKSLGGIGESGSLPPIGEGAKRLLQGDSPAKAAMGAAGSGIKEKAKGLLGKITGKSKGSGQKKAVDIEESIDVGVPVSTAYDQWTQFTEFSRFMKGVESVEQSSETETTWRAKVFKSRRTWKATVQEQIPDQRIVWTSEGAKGSTKGVVTFHPLGDNLTRVLLTMEYFPQGLFEKTGNMWRAQGRRARLDLKNFRRFVTTEGQATGSWRGEVHDGQVTKGPDEDEQGGGSEDKGGRSGNGRAGSGNGRSRSSRASEGTSDGKSDGSSEQKSDARSGNGKAGARAGQKSDSTSGEKSDGRSQQRGRRKPAGASR